MQRKAVLVKDHVPDVQRMFPLLLHRGHRELCM